MELKKLKLTAFRNHLKSDYNFSQTTIFIGENTAGKTSIIEAIVMLSQGKSFKAEKDLDTIHDEDEFARIDALINEGEEKTQLAIIVALKNNRAVKKYLVNNVPRWQTEFTSHLTTVLFTPEDLEIINDSPSVRRSYINSVLAQSDKKYRTSLNVYEKALKRRNRMLYLSREGKKYFSPEEFEYWDNLIIENGQIITKYREEFVEFINNATKEISLFELHYDKSIMSRARLDQYRLEERAAAKTLVGPQRDDFIFKFDKKRTVREYGSRGEQRLTILQTKLIESLFLIEKTEKIPVLLLDDIFSELDESNIQKVLDLLPHHQVIITTTHEEFIPKSFLKREGATIIEL